jgi:hypothetical protein
MQGLVIGAPSFMSPEQARGARSDHVDADDAGSPGERTGAFALGERGARRTAPDDPNRPSTKRRGAAGANATLETTASTANAKTSAASARAASAAATGAPSAAAAVDPDDVDGYADGGKAPAVGPSESGSGGQTNEEPAPKGGAAPASTDIDKP